jgi:hypothetical protein
MQNVTLQSCKSAEATYLFDENQHQKAVTVISEQQLPSMFVWILQHID